MLLLPPAGFPCYGEGGAAGDKKAYKGSPGLFLDI